MSRISYEYSSVASWSGASRFTLGLILSGFMWAVGCESAGRLSNEAISSAGTVPASGMARLAERQFVVVIDTNADELGPRLGVLDLAGRLTPRYAELTANWDEFGGPANDLESVCAIPGRAGEFLAAESGYWQGRFGRVFHFVIIPGERDRHSARIIQVLKLPRHISQIEGMTIGQAANGELILLYGERGSDKLPARISWGRLLVDSTAIEFQFHDELSFRAPYLLESDEPRNCSDLFIDNQNRLWAAAAVDRGDDGPFQSVIFRLGMFDPRRKRPVMRLDPLTPTWILDGFKVEAIAADPDDPRTLSFITDDESYGGVWRPLPRPREPWELDMSPK